MTRLHSLSLGMRGAGATMRSISSGGGRVASRLAASSPRRGMTLPPMAWRLAWSRPRMPPLVGSGHGPRAVWGRSRAMSMDSHLNVPPPDVRELRDSFGSIIKVFTVTASPNWCMPWYLPSSSPSPHRIPLPPSSRSLLVLTLPQADEAAEGVDGVGLHNRREAHPHQRSLRRRPVPCHRAQAW